MKFDLIVTRHQGLVDYLLNEKVITGTEMPEMISHVADPAVLDGKRVLGVLPLSLAVRCASVTELVLDLPAELRGKELSVDQLREYSRGLKTYRVESL